jgi:hypothetical protein
VVIEDVCVHYRLDQAGRLLLSSNWIGDDGRNERLMNLAIRVVRREFELGLIQARHASRIETATKEQRKAARQHWSNEWLERAHRKTPTLGAERLARRARQMLAERQLAERPQRSKKQLWADAKKRDEISVHRARAYLKATRKKSGER